MQLSFIMFSSLVSSLQLSLSPWLAWFVPGVEVVTTEEVVTAEKTAENMEEETAPLLQLEQQTALELQGPTALTLPTLK